MNFQRNVRYFICFFLIVFLFSIQIHQDFISYASLAGKKPVDIVVVEQPPKGNDKSGNPYDRDSNKDGVTALDETYNNYKDKKDKLGIEHVLRATSVKNMVDNILGALKEDECIQSLVIAGHGAPGVIGVGDGLNSEPGNHINGENKKEWEAELKRLKDKFCPGASLLLKGCNVGSCELGAKKLKELADLLGIPVEAPTGLTHPDCSSEKGSVNQRAEPTKKGEKPDPPKCILSPADQAKLEAEATYKGALPFELGHVMGLEIYPIGGPIPVSDVPMLDIKPGEELFDQFMKGINYEKPIIPKYDLLSKCNAVLLFRFEDGTMKMGMFHTDFDYFIYPYEPGENYTSANYYPSLDYRMELGFEEICRKKLGSSNPSTEFNLTAKAECGYIQLNWSAVPGAITYYIYRGPGEGQEYPMPLTDFPIPETSYKDEKGLILNQKYCYFVQAVNNEDKEFKKSNETCVVYTCKEEIPPIGEQDCKMVLKYQVDNKFYWKNDIQKGPMDATPIIRENRVNLMARYVAEETGALVGWDQATKTVLITRTDGVVIKMQIGNPIATVGGAPTPIDPNNPMVVPFILNNRTYTGLRFIAYNLGATGPDEIIWRAETRIAELIFKDPNCKWLCGCFRNVSVTSVANIAELRFFESCLPSKPEGIKIAKELKDQVLKITVLEYRQKYPNQEYWCAEVRVDELGNIVAWRARPDLYPNCCEQGEEPNKKGGIRVKVICSTTTAVLPVTGLKINVYKSSDNSLVWSGLTNNNGVVESGLILEPAPYKITSSEDSTKCSSIFPAMILVAIVPDIVIEKQFSCDCIAETKDKGRMVGRVTNIVGKPMPGKVVQIIESYTKKLEWQGTTDTNGYFDTECKLTCGHYYDVNTNACQAKKEKVYVPCCPGKAEAFITCQLA